MRTKQIEIKKLNKPEVNSRRHSENQIQEMAKCVEKFGQIRPIVIDENNTVWCGNGLVEAFKVLGREKIDALPVEGLSESDKKKLMLADNKLYQLGFDDAASVEQIMLELDDFEIPGFDADTLESLYGDLDDSIAEFMNYGKATEQEIETIERKGEEFRKEQESAVEMPLVKQVASDTKEERIVIQTTPEEPTAITGKYVTCPRCGERIWL